MLKSINELVKLAYKNAVDKGWWETERSFGELIALIHSELSEALEDYRSGHDVNSIWHEAEKPCGIPIELADVIIRIFDLCGKYEIDLEEAIVRKMLFNSTREKRHGGKKI